MGVVISKLMIGLYKDYSDHEIKCFSKKSNDSYMSCTKINAISIFFQKHSSKNCENETLKTFNETAQTGNMSVFL